MRIEYLYIEGQEANPCDNGPLKVRLDGKIVGEIRKVKGGFQYFAKGNKNGGLIFSTVTAVQEFLGTPK